MSAILEAEQLGLVYPGPGGGHRAIENISFQVDKGETLALVGESGCGKSTVAKCLLALLRPTEGRVLIDGACVSDLKGRRLREFRSRIQMVFQDPYGSLDPRLTAGALVAEAVALRHPELPRRRQLKSADEFLSRVGLPQGSSSKRAPEFSGGQRQRIGIARALAAEPEIVVLDEATSALDVSVQAEILTLLKRLQAETQVTFVMISHNLGVVREVSDRIVVMRRGRIEEQGDTDSVLDHPTSDYTKLLRSAALDPVAMQGIKPRATVAPFGRLLAKPTTEGDAA